MPDLETLSERVSTLERTLTDGEIPELRDDAELQRTTAELAARLDELEAKQDELDASVQALRGYVGAVRAVNADVERRADAALATAEACQTELESNDSRDSHADFHRDDPASSSDVERRTPSPTEIPPFEPVESGNRTESDERSLTARIRELL